MIRDSHTAPIRVVSPACQVAEDLRLATALLSPEKCSSIGAFPAFVCNSADILGSPVMVAELMIALQIQLISQALFLL